MPAPNRTERLDLQPGWLDYWEPAWGTSRAGAGPTGAHPDDIDVRRRQKWREPGLSTGECFEAETRVRRADGAVSAWVWMRATSLRDETSRIWMDGAGIDGRRSASAG